MTLHVAIWNPASGSAPDEAELRDAVGGADVDVELVETTADDPGTGQARDAVARGAKTVVACGGDGTIRACLEGVAGSDTDVAIVPLGTGNLLAANLGVPTGLDAAPEALQRRRRTIDVGRANGELFAVMAGIGFDAALIRDSEKLGKSRLGRAAYGLAGVKNVPTKLIATTITVDGRRFFDGRTSMVLVGNLPTVTGGLDVFPDAQPDDGLLDVGVLKASTLREWMTVLWRLIRNKPQPQELVERIQAKRVEVTVSRPQPVELDGEPREPTTRFNVEIEPASVHLLAREPRAQPYETHGDGEQTK